MHIVELFLLLLDLLGNHKIQVKRFEALGLEKLHQRLHLLLKALIFSLELIIYRRLFLRGGGVCFFNSLLFLKG